jgi:DNA repair protein RadA
VSDKKIKGLESLSEEIVEMLLDAGYKTAKSIAIALPEDLAEDADFSVEYSEQLIEKAINSVANPPMTAEDVLKDEQERGKLTTSSLNLDSLLDGGVWEREITEFSGGFATGKSQVCFQLAINAQLPKDKGGLGGKVFFIDTEGTFSAKRIGEIAIAMDLDPHEVLRNIFVARALDSRHQIRLVKNISDMIKEHNIKLVIVDSIASHFRTDYVQKEQLAERQQRIMQHGSSLTNLAYVHGVAVVVTNQIVAQINEFSSSQESKPALGQAWAHRPQTRILLRKSPGAARVARLLDSPRRAEGEEVFYITPDGISDKNKPRD